MTIYQALVQISEGTIYTAAELQEAAYCESATAEQRLLKHWVAVQLMEIFPAS